MCRIGNTTGASMTSRRVDDPSPLGRQPRQGPRPSIAVVRIVALVVLVAGLFVLAELGGLPDVKSLRVRVDSAGGTGWLVFVLGYAMLALVPAPKGAMTALGGLFFGWVAGAALSWLGALIGALLAFEVGRLLGRDAVDRLVRGRLARVDALLASHGFGAVVAVRLVPVLPYTVINYASGVTGVRRRDYVLGTALGMVPGSLAYSALGAWGADPWGLFAALAALLVLVLVGGIWGRRLLAARGGPAATSPAVDAADRPGDEGSCSTRD